MSEQCAKCKERPSKGAIGLLRLCCECVAELTGESKRVIRSRRVQVALVAGQKFQAFAEWVPDFIAARYTARKKRRADPPPQETSEPKL